MPMDRPGVLSAQQNADVIAFMLSADHYPAGKTELSRQVAFLSRSSNRAGAVSAAVTRYSAGYFFALETSGTFSPSAVARSIWCSCSCRRISRMSSAIAYSPSASHCRTRSR